MAAQSVKLLDQCKVDTLITSAVTMPRGLKTLARGTIFGKYWPHLDCFMPHLALPWPDNGFLLYLGLQRRALPWSLPQILCFELHPGLRSDEDVGVVF